MPQPPLDLNDAEDVGAGGTDAVETLDDLPSS